MKTKIIDPSRIRRVPSQFNWVDHRLIRHRLLSGCSSRAWALYLFLVTVADAEGISYYANRSLCAHLGFAVQDLPEARGELIGAGLLAWEAPYYQVLALEEHPHSSQSRRPGPPRPRSNRTLDIADILENALKGGER